MIRIAKPIFIAVILFSALVLSPSPRAAERFVAGLGELPLMPGLVELVDRRLIYEKPDGRIINAVARGAPNVVDVRNFYRETLPQLGWRKLSDSQYQREQEILTLTIIRLLSESEVQYKIAPEK